MGIFKTEITIHFISSVFIAGVLFSYVFSKHAKKTFDPISRFCCVIIAIAMTCWGLYYVPDLVGRTKQVTGTVTNVSYTYHSKHLLSAKRSKRIYEITVVDSSGRRTVLYDSNIFNYNMSNQETPFLLNQTYEFSYLSSSKMLIDFNLRK